MGHEGKIEILYAISCCYMWTLLEEHLYWMAWLCLTKMQTSQYLLMRAGGVNEGLRIRVCNTVSWAT